MSRLSLDRKFALVCAILIASTVLLGGIGIFMVNYLLSSVRSLAVDSLRRVWIMGQVQSVLLELQNESWRHIASYDANDMTVAEANVEKLKAQMQGLFDQYEKTLTSPDDRKLYSQTRPLYQRYLAAWEEVRPISRSGIGAAAHQAFIEKADPAFRAVMEAAGAQVESNRRAGEVSRTRAVAAANNAQVGTWLLVAICSSLGALLVFITIRSLKGALNAAITDVARGVDQTRTVADQVSASSKLVADGAVRQVSSLAKRPLLRNR